MPSENRVPAAAFDAVSGAIAAFQGALRATAETVGRTLDIAAADPGHVRVEAELGAFAAGRIDMARFAALDGQQHMPHESERTLLRQARDVLRTDAAMLPTRFVVDVPSGGCLADALTVAFTTLGRGFGAMQVAEAVRTGRTSPDEHAEWLRGWPRRRWSRSERAVSPPLVVLLDGADLHVGDLGAYLDGNQRIVLVVRGPAPPAALVRLITPGTLVLQTHDEAALARLASCGGPAIAALFTEECAEFDHVPDASLPLHARLHVRGAPKSVRVALSDWSRWEQQEELRQLLAMAEKPAVAATASSRDGATAADPADRLAAWLLARAGAPPAQ